MVYKQTDRAQRFNRPFRVRDSSVLNGRICLINVGINYFSFRLLTILDFAEAIELINTLEIPLCTILRLKEKLNNLCKGNIPFPVVHTSTFTKIGYPRYKLLT